MVKLPMTFTADEEIQESMKLANIGNKKKSKWINEQIKKGLLHDKKPEEKISIRVKPTIKEVII